MEKNEFTEKKLQKALDDAIAHGNTKEAERLVAELYAFEEQRDIKMPQDFPAKVMTLAAQERNEKMTKKKSVRKIVASVAAFAIVLSFGVTAYAQGWFQNPISVLENKNAVVTGENINEENLDAALAEDAAKEDLYKKSETASYPDFVTACEAIGLPAVYPEYLTQHPEFATLEGNVYATTNPELSDKGVYADFFHKDTKQGISMSLAYQENPDDVIAAFDDHMDVQNTRTFTTEAGDTFTLYDLHYVEYEGEYLVEANIAINHYLFNMMFAGIDAAEIEAALNSVDLTPLKS